MIHQLKKVKTLGLHISKQLKTPNQFISHLKLNNANTHYQPIADFYSGKSVFLTGGTGFLGKVLIEKILRSCPKLDKLYLLIREKKGVDINTRLKNLFDDALFTRLKESSEDYFGKVVPICGDVAFPRLGLNSEDENTLIEKVSVVIHSAATVKFNEPLSVAININLEGTQEVLNLCKRINNIQAFVYISTAYAHCQLPIISEVVYPAPAKLEDVYKFIEENGDNERETLKFIRDKPNTYTYSKALAESYVAENHENIPTVIVRPSAVTSTIHEPLKGWLDNWFGVSRFIHNNSKGWNHFIYGRHDFLIDLIPVDFVSNLIIIAATRAQQSNEIQVFNVCSSGENPLTWGDFCRYAVKDYIKNGRRDVPCFNTIYFFNSRKIVNLLTIVLQKFPLHIIDFWLNATGKQPKYVNMMSKVVNLRNTSDYFTHNSWEFKAERTRKLFSTLSPEDQIAFPCDPMSIKWPEYVTLHLNGIYAYLKPQLMRRTTLAKI